MSTPPNPLPWGDAAAGAADAPPCDPPKALTLASAGVPHGSQEQACKVVPMHFFSPLRCDEVTAARPGGLREVDASFTGHGVGLEGPPRSGRTSLIFQYAMNVASQGCRVLYFCEEGKLLRQPPTPEQDVGSTAEQVLHRIELKYIDSSDAIVPHLAGLHELPADRRPSVIIVDDFDLWYRHDTLAAVHALAVLEDTVRWLSLSGVVADGGGGVAPHFIVAFAPVDFPIRRWLKVVGSVAVTQAGPSTIAVVTFQHAPPSNAWLHASANPAEAMLCKGAYTLSDGRLRFRNFKAVFVSDGQ